MTSSSTPRRSGQTIVETQRLAFARWEWRFRWGRYVEGRHTVAWREYENGQALSERGARRKAVRHLRRLELARRGWTTREGLL